MEHTFVSPEDVVIVSEVKTLYRGKDDTAHWYLSEREARSHAANANKCTTVGCQNYTKRFYLHCDECSKKIEKEKHQKKLDASPEWNGQYPVCVGYSFFFDEESLIEHLDLNDIDLSSVFDLYTCKAVLAKDTIKRDWITEYIEENLPEDTECPNEIQKIIDRFMNDLASVSEPVSWVVDKLVRITDEQRNRLKELVKEYQE